MAGNVQINDRKVVREQKARSLGYTPREWDRINEMDKKAHRTQIRLAFILAGLLLILLFLSYAVFYMIFRSHDFELSMPFDKNSVIYGIPENLESSSRAKGFADGLCVTDTDVALDQIYMEAFSAGLFDLGSRKVMYAKDCFAHRSPASLTKIMTALVALRYGNIDDLVTVTDTAKDIEFGSSVCDIKTGDVLSLKQLLYGMLIASGNDAAMIVAEHVGGSVENFVAMMNEEARRIGAADTNFTNPHGLTDNEHYTCVYDLYLIFREAMQYDLFMDMISRKNYYAEYKNAAEDPVAVTWESTNHYFTGEAHAPDDVFIYGGKTGTTEDAGGCLALLVKDIYGNPYISIIMHAADRNIVYDDMNKLLEML